MIDFHDIFQSFFTLSVFIFGHCWLITIFLEILLADSILLSWVLLYWMVPLFWPLPPHTRHFHTLPLLSCKFTTICTQFSSPSSNLHILLLLSHLLHCPFLICVAPSLVFSFFIFCLVFFDSGDWTRDLLMCSTTELHSQPQYFLSSTTFHLVHSCLGISPNTFLLNNFYCLSVFYYINI